MTEVIRSLPPGLILMLGALLVPVLRGKARAAWMLLLPVLGFIQLLLMPAEMTATTQLFDLTFTYIRVDGLSRVWGYIFYLATFISVLYALHVKDDQQNIAALTYTGAAIGAVFAGDLITLFIYWELTAITSVFLIWARRTERAWKVGMRYLIIQVASGVLLLAGALLHYHHTGSLAFDNFLNGSNEITTLGQGLILLSFGIKAAFPFLHNWLQDAYPEATETGTVFLSAFTTKLAIYALARGFAGLEWLVPIGATMTCFPIFFAVIENDLRRVLAFSLNNQLGFMVVGVGIGSDLAINGAAAHAFAHILYKGLLFMATGAVLYRAGTIKASELGGLYRTMPKTAFFCIIGAMSISAFPAFSGFVSKGMILAAAATEHYQVTFFVLLFASAGVMEHSGIKIPYFTFFAHDSGKRPKEAPLHMLLAMGIAAFFCVGIGVYPAPLYAILPHPVDFVPYDLTHIVTQMQLLLFSMAAFVFLQKSKLYPPEIPSTNLDFDWVYRKAAPAVIRGIARGGMAVIGPAHARAMRLYNASMLQIRRYHSPGGRLGEPWSTSKAALWAAVILGAYLVLAFAGRG